MDRKENNFYFVIGLILLASFSRFIPHYPNFTPIIAISLFGGKYFENRTLAFFLPVFILWFGDLVINNFILDYYKAFTFFYPGFYWQYLSIFLISFIGRNYINKISTSKLLGISISSSLVFFVISNFGVFVTSSIYSKDLNGLLLCYTAAIPFFWGTISSSIIYTFSLFGIYKFIYQNKFKLLRNN